MASTKPERVVTDHSGAPDPKAAKGVKLAAGVAFGALGVLLLVTWAIVSALN